MISILQPHIPHYREDFFLKLMQENELSIFSYDKHSTKQHFKKSLIPNTYIKNIQLGPFLIYNPFSLLKNSETMILMLHIGHISTWILLLSKPLHKRKIILWGHGISVKRYISEKENPSMAMKLMISLADKVWLYTEQEKKIWGRIFSNKVVSLNNTISGIEKIFNHKNEHSIDLKNKYHISQEFCFIFCARFNATYRRTDLLEEAIKQLNHEKYAFIIIGEGEYKPDFSQYKNVYDFGAVYEKELKDDLFTIADLYFQPAWVGLSIVEALAYGLPICTFKRSEYLIQGVEYGYLIDGFNSIIVRDVNEFISNISTLSPDKIKEMSENSRQYAVDNLLMDIMSKNAINTL